MDVKTQLQSQWLTIDHSKIHYVESGEGDPILFLHGMPTSSYLWRNIIPHFNNSTRCIAPDLIGMGQSDKPDIAYTLADHIHYIEHFIEQLDLRDITLVVHGWGSAIGFDIAARHPERFKALAFFESHVRPTLDWDRLSLPVQQLAAMLTTPEKAHHAVVEDNFMLEVLLPNGVVTELEPEVMQAYAKPFKTAKDRQVFWQYLMDLPLGVDDGDVVKRMSAYSDWLQQTTLPKLMLYAVPGFITTIDTVNWAKNNLSNLSLECLDDVMHFAQESAPHLFAVTLKQWYKKL